MGWGYVCWLCLSLRVWLGPNSCSLVCGIQNTPNIMTVSIADPNIKPPNYFLQPTEKTCSFFCCCCFFYLPPVCLLYVRAGHSVCNDNQAWQSSASNDALRASGKEAAMDLMKTRHKRKPAPSALNIVTHNVHMSTYTHTHKQDRCDLSPLKSIIFPLEPTLFPLVFLQM